MSTKYRIWIDRMMEEDTYMSVVVGSTTDEKEAKAVLSFLQKNNFHGAHCETIVDGITLIEVPDGTESEFPFAR